ncbi:o-succinylbenzoate synthase [Secundilactobacillus kimchicus]|uniref:o-succinylbenzoate synthase n=1 Tax=Secundilactobacillus kimchicus TaxID=528209 RepID=UPI001C023EC9|nr:o-succinylbenzoate synthase [Secundilactobacillus kimchicus]MBT9672690.1 o-succinylbenzoate synthase [Secundilactobacillus kimchicus]
MRLTELRVLPVAVPLRQPFRSAHEQLKMRQLTLIYLRSDAGFEAVGELEAFTEPGYSPELQESERQALLEQLVPVLKAAPTVPELTAESLWPNVAGHRMAKAAIELPLWSLKAQEAGLTLAELLARSVGDTVQPAIPVGISLGVADLATQLKRIKWAVTAGYSRVKLKVAGLDDLSTVKAVRQAFPRLQLIVDGNEAFQLTDAAALATLAAAEVIMIEQPLRAGDFVGHAKLQASLPFAICLDEDILSVEDVERVVRLGSARSLNLKPSRVGGFVESLKILRLANAHQLDCWVGGMVESSVGRYYAQSLAQLSSFKFPGDVGPSEQFFTAPLSTWQPPLRNRRLQLGDQPMPKLTPEMAARFQRQCNLLA